VDIGGEKVVKPVVSGLAQATNWTIVITSALGVLACMWMLTRWQRDHRS
jgi:hypothetical protein